MANSFLLRFQERCDDSRPGEVAAGIKTLTKVHREQADVTSSESAFKTVDAGTSTCTRVRSEQGDSDYGLATRTLPVGPIMGTMTSTAVKMEADDKDSCGKQLTALPKCF